jgi:class 3 adenylate cyclase
VVTANGQLDYFGQTVNVASRIQHLPGSSELLLAAEYAEDLPPETRAAVMISEPFEARVKGVDAPLHLVRMKLRATGSRDA